MVSHTQFKKFLINLVNHKIPKELIVIIETDPTYFTPDCQLNLIAEYFKDNKLDLYIKYIPRVLFYISDRSCISTYDEEIKSSTADEIKHDYIECPICLGEPDENIKITQLVCSHIYHYKCIAEWKLIRNACPLCSRLIKYKTKTKNRIKNNIPRLIELSVRIEEILANINRYCFFGTYNINNYYLLYQLVLKEKINTTEIEGKCLFDNIMLLSREDLIKNNDIWKRICKKCNWGYSSIL